MIMDYLLQFDPNPTPITVTAFSTNTLDMLNAREMGIGADLELNIEIVTALAGGTSLNIQLLGSADNATFTLIQETGVMLTAVLGAGNVFNLELAHRSPGQAVPRYYKLQYVVVGTYTSGAVAAQITRDRQTTTYYPPGIAVLN